MSSKKYAIFLIVLILFLSLLLTSTSIIQDVSFSISGRASAVREKDVPTAVNRLIKEKKVLVDLKNNNTCYWIQPSYDKTNSYLSITKYDKKFGRCVGVVKDRINIPIEGDFKMFSSGCICDGEGYVLELKKVGNIEGLKISKTATRMSIQQRLSLDVSGLIQKLIGIFTKKGS